MLLWTEQDWRAQPPEGTKPRELPGVGRPIFLHYGRALKDRSEAGVFTRTSSTFGAERETQCGPGRTSFLADFDAGSEFLSVRNWVTVVIAARLESLRTVAEQMCVMSSQSDFLDGYASVLLNAFEQPRVENKPTGGSIAGSTVPRSYVAGESIFFCATVRGSARSVYVSSGQSVLSTGVSEIAARYVRIGNSGSNISQQLTAIYDGGVSADLAQEIAKNPWWVFAPRRILIPTAAATGPTVLALTPTTIGSTTARVRYSITY